MDDAHRNKINMKTQTPVIQALYSNALTVALLKANVQTNIYSCL